MYLKDTSLLKQHPPWNVTCVNRPAWKSAGIILIMRPLIKQIAQVFQFQDTSNTFQERKMQLDAWKSSKNVSFPHYFSRFLYSFLLCLSFSKKHFPKISLVARKIIFSKSNILKFYDFLIIFKVDIFYTLLQVCYGFFLFSIRRFYVEFYILHNL